MSDTQELSFTILAFVASVIVYLWVYRWRQRGRLGPKEWPVVGALFEFQANAHRIHDWVCEYSKKSPNGTFQFTAGGVRQVMVTSLENVQYILKTNFPNYIKGPTTKDRLEELLGSGIFNSDGNVWRQQRKAASFEFSSHKLRDTSTDAYRNHALRLMIVLDTMAESQRESDIQDLFLRMTMDSICKIGFGVDQRNLSPDLPQVEFANAFDTLARWTAYRAFDVTWKLKRMFNIGREKKYKALLPTLDSFTYAVIQDRRKELEKLKAMGQELDRHDLLSRFMGVKDENGEGYSDKMLRDAILSFVIAGRDTSACTLSWFVYILCLQPEVAEKCYQELNQAFGEVEDDLDQGSDRLYKFGKLLTYESLGQLHYLHAAISETLRLYTPVARDGKYAVKDDTLPDGTIVKAGNQVIYSPYSMGRMEVLWGPDAMEYRPERWLKDGCYQHESPFKFSAFQAGPRVCLGKDTAYLQMLMTAAMFLRWFRFQLVPNQSIFYNVSLVMTIKGGLKVTAQRR